MELRAALLMRRAGVSVVCLTIAISHQAFKRQIFIHSLSRVGTVGIFHFPPSPLLCSLFTRLLLTWKRSAPMELQQKCKFFTSHPK
jgi:hypothetical protein